MKKLILFTIIIFVCAGLHGQNTFKYEVRVPSIRVGGATKVKVDSISSSGTDIKFYTGAARLMPLDTTYLSDRIDLKLNEANGTTTGTLTTAALNVGNRNLSMDSVSLVDGDIAFWDGVDTLGLHINQADIIELSDVAVMLVDSITVGAGHYVTPKQLNDSLSGFSGGISAGDVAAQINDTIVARLAAAVAGIRVADTASMLSPYFNLTEIRKVNSDTIPLFIFGAGSGGAEIDTALFTTSNIYGSFYNAGSDTLVITSLRAVMIAGTTPSGTDTLSIQVYWNDTINVTTGASFVVLNTNPLGINSVTTGTVDNSFNNASIPPNVWVFCKSPGVVTGRKPKALTVQLSGYKQNRRY